MIVKTLELGILYTNCYIVMDENTKEAVVIDPAGDEEEIFAAIEELGAAVKYIMLTHAHFDHILACKALKDATGAQIVLHENDRDIMSEQYVVNFRPMLKGKYKEIFPDILVKDRDCISFGNLTATFIHTPGHTSGSCCIIIDDYVFSGDTLFRGSCGRWDLDGGNFEDIKKSLKLLYAMDKDYKVMPGHGPATTLFAEKETNPYMQNALKS